MYLKFIIIIIIFLFIEILLKVFFQRLLKYTKRFYTEETFRPKFNQQILEKFYKKSYSQELGWDNHLKNKENEKFLKKKGKKILTFGDSYVFGKFSDEKDKWQFHLNKKTNLKVLNYGVNNHGLDQSFLKIKSFNKYIKSNTVIIGFVPETILRITTCWKHFYEFGNIYAFKPRFSFDNKKLKLFKNPVDKNLSIKSLNKLVLSLKKQDPGYKLFFKDNLIKFPIIFLFFKDFNYFFRITLYVFLYRYFKVKNIKNKIINLIISRNIKLSHKFYKKKIKTNLIENILKKLKKECKKKKSDLIIVIFPQLYDLKFHSRKNYSDFFEEIAKKNNLNIIDLTYELERRDYRKFYLNDKFGGHFNKMGNKLVSDLIYIRLNR
tara:strand:- start:49 stop:1182 length:1134 start_codon:yes stop_codon:yes gene_type:complete